jgi:hypothetical protein
LPSGIFKLHTKRLSLIRKRLHLLGGRVADAAKNVLRRVFKSPSRLPPAPLKVMNDHEDPNDVLFRRDGPARQLCPGWDGRY